MKLPTGEKSNHFLMRHTFLNMPIEFNLAKIFHNKQNLFEKDLLHFENKINELIANGSFLVMGGAGSIGSATVKEIFKRNPKKLHVVDINENNLVELVRDIRSSLGYISGEFKTFALDIGSDIFDRFIEEMEGYDYVLNFSALKHVRSEKDPYTLMRMVEVNILNTVKTIELFINSKVKKYFCVSTDKASNPVNMMGASKRIMELFLMKYSEKINISTARFANVAFSDGSLLYSWVLRMQKKQPIVAPKGIKRYFITQDESGILCLLSTLLGENKELYFPKLSPEKDLLELTELALKFVENQGYKPYICETEEEARKLAPILPEKGKWAVYFSEPDTTGEKDHEEFFTSEEKVILDKFEDIGIVKLDLAFEEEKLDYFIEKIGELRQKGWKKKDLVDLFKYLLPNFMHKETGKYLDEKM